MDWDIPEVQGGPEGNRDSISLPARWCSMSVADRILSLMENGKMLPRAHAEGPGI